MHPRLFLINLTYPFLDIYKTNTPYVVADEGDGVVVRGDDDGGSGCSDEAMMLARCGGLDGGDEPAVMAAVVRGGAVAIWWQP
nr:hypothetical protein [Tanacetum cinerariifolium]